jgi:endonuclease III
MKHSLMSDDAAILAAYISALSDFALVERGEPYNHMGATITDAILQAGMRYVAQVRPRIQRLLTEYPEAATTSDFQRLLVARTPEVIVGINGRKAVWVQQMTDFFVEQHVETEANLLTWLGDPAHEQALFQLKGVGLKTVNYLKLLVGLRDSVAVDTHVRAFLTAAGIVPSDDRAAGAIVAHAAVLMGVSATQLDASIWSYRKH